MRAHHHSGVGRISKGKDEERRESAGKGQWLGYDTDKKTHFGKQC